MFRIGAQPGAPVKRRLDGGQRVALGAGLARRGKMPISPQGDQGMSWWNGVSTCRELGVDGCVVWWEGWAAGAAVLALFVAITALVVAFWGVLATVISSIAVWRLGQKANHLAESGAEQVRIERDVLAEAQSAERAREEVIVLSYISAELSAIYPSIAALNAQLAQDGAAARFVDNQGWRQLWHDDVGELRTPRIESTLQLLYRLPSNMGGRIARILGDVQTIQEVLKSVAPTDLSLETNDEHRRLKESWLRTLYAVAKNASERAAADIAHCSLEATRASLTIGGVPPRS